ILIYTSLIIQLPSSAYRHILKGLQTVNPRLLPFASSIVGVNREPGPPRYVDARPCYDFSVILEGSASQPPIRPSFGPPIRSPPSIRLDIDVLAEKWEPFPTSLDVSQLNALKTILTKRLAIVQGPPGTGKTYVGLQAVKLILHNFDHRLMGPIICICQTNHALDQFLEGILKFEDSIVRVGGRSKSEDIKLKTMYQLRQNMDRPQKAQGQFYNYRRREDLERQIRGLLEELHEEPCVSVGFLRAGKRMNERQIDSLERGRPEKKTAPKQENKREGAKNETDWLPEDEDSDDDEWIFTSAVKPQDKFGNDSRPGAQKPSIRGSGRLNGPAERTPPPAPPPKLNRVEEWIKEALTTKPFFSGAGGVLDEFKEDLLEANKGLVFVNDADEEIDEEQLREILEEVQEFREDQSRALLEKFIGLGDAYWADPASGGGLNMGGEGRAGGGSFDPGPWSGMQGRGGSANGGGNGRQQSGLVKGAGNGRQQQGGKTLSPSVQARLRMEEETRERKIVNYGRYLHDEETEDGEEGDDSLKTVQEKDISKWKKVDDVHAWPLEVKLEMHRRWIRERDEEIEKKILKIVEEYQQVTADIKRANVSNDAKLCRANRIVGMTSTAAAKYHDLLEEIGPRIIIFEEAAEMLEAHIITALTKSVEQLVLIGYGFWACLLEIGVGARLE
ncbi:P-loop containing nucleoside triphosphate hydrolase protein, partial [Jimgerdemannia flammicorona]